MKLVFLLSLSLFLCCASFVATKSPTQLSNCTSNICIIRPDMKLGSWVALSILIEDSLAMKLRINSYAYWPVSEGLHEIKTLPSDTLLVKPSKLALTIGKNESKYVVIKENFQPDKMTYDLIELNESEAKALITNCKLIK